MRYNISLKIVSFVIIFVSGIKEYYSYLRNGVGGDPLVWFNLMDNLNSYSVPYITFVDNKSPFWLFIQYIFYNSGFYYEVFILFSLISHFMILYCIMSLSNKYGGVIYSLTILFIFGFIPSNDIIAIALFMIVIYDIDKNIFSKYVSGILLGISLLCSQWVLFIIPVVIYFDYNIKYISIIPTVLLPYIMLFIVFGYNSLLHGILFTIGLGDSYFTNQPATNYAFYNNFSLWFKYTILFNLLNYVFLIYFSILYIFRVKFNKIILFTAALSILLFFRAFWIYIIPFLTIMTSLEIEFLFGKEEENV